MTTSVPFRAVGAPMPAFTISLVHALRLRQRISFGPGEVQRHLSWGYAWPSCKGTEEHYNLRVINRSFTDAVEWAA